MHKKRTLIINEKNDIESIIDSFQLFEKQYEIKISNLEEGIQYETENFKIAQTYKTTLLKTDMGKLIKKIKNKGKITIIVIDNVKNKRLNKKIDKKIRKLNSFKNIKTRITSENKRYEILKSILEGN